MRDIFARDESGGVGSPGSSGKQQYLQPQQRLKMAQKFIIGLYSYDLHDNREYASKWGLDTEIDDSLKRRLGELMTQTGFIYFYIHRQIDNLLCYCKTLFYCLYSNYSICMAP